MSLLLIEILPREFIYILKFCYCLKDCQLKQINIIEGILNVGLNISLKQRDKSYKKHDKKSTNMQNK